ncbi:MULTISPECIES: PhnD/SsuA/transferrin family substrate-binding protein [unclassified Solibacillus]|uniref:PhnD/SsuA/transferrin family substrate-binding protein n=1 Tax=unclassified Solibacillus TaxID=2637870 RepID=UPI0030FB2687
MKKLWKLPVVGMLSALLLVGCNSSDNESSTDSASANSKEPLVVVWYPNESGSEMGPSRDAFGELFEEATGREVEHKLTTDYAIAIETIANGNAQVAFMGAQGYIEANKKNEAVEPLVVTSGESGTLDDALYYSWLAVPKEKANAYKVNEEFDLDTTEGKSISFVSPSSTSGFKMPASTIISHFSDKGLKEEDLMEGNAVYPSVVFGGSHQGAAVNMLMGRTDIASFCDTCVDPYIEIVEGEANKPGTVYRVRDNAAPPFNTMPGEEFTLIQVTPVLNAPFAVNTEVLSEEEISKLKEALTSDATAKNEEIFMPKEKEQPSLFYTSGNERFLEVDDQWFDPIRELSK